MGCSRAHALTQLVQGTTVSSAKIKKLIREEFGYNVRCQSGRGTSHYWKYIVIPDDITVPEDVRENIEQRLVEENLCGQYFPDAFPGKDKWTPCILWLTETQSWRH